MNFPNGLFPAGWMWGALVVLVPTFIWAVLTAPWRRLADARQLHGWAGAIVVLMLMWSISAGVKPGLNLHILGATALTLMFGRQLAMIGLALVLAAVTFNGGAGWQPYALNALVLAVLPVFLAYGILRLMERLLPAHMFVYIFVAAFFGAAVAVVLTGLAAMGLLYAAGVYPLAMLLSDYFPYYILLGFAEAWMNGAAITLLVVYFPHWVATFDDRRYLLNK
jgi:uncharacterized membrane protein